MARVVHFEIHADDPQRASAFYQHVFGWHVEKWDGPMDYWLVRTGEQGTPGIDGGLLERQGDARVVNTIDVKSVDAALETIQQQGGHVVQGKTEVPGVGYMAYCTDTEGNTFGIMEMVPAQQPA